MKPGEIYTAPSGVKYVAIDDDSICYSDSISIFNCNTICGFCDCPDDSLDCEEATCSEYNVHFKKVKEEQQ